QTILAIAEVQAGKNGWNGAPFIGWSTAMLSKPNLVASLATLPGLSMSEVPAPRLQLADETKVVLLIDGLAASPANYSVWRRPDASGTWTYLKSVAVPLNGTSALVADSTVSAQ